MKMPSHYTLDNIRCILNNSQNVSSKLINGKWVPARPEGYYSLFDRFEYAWMVFIGKADILTWPGDQ